LKAFSGNDVNLFTGNGSEIAALSYVAALKVVISPIKIGDFPTCWLKMFDLMGTFPKLRDKPLIYEG
jgi:hypothetical protein